MTRRIAACLALVAFAVCILSGLQAGNPFSSVVGKALVALAVTFGVGLVIGAMAQRMLDENVGKTAENVAAPKNSEAKHGPSDR